MTNGDTLNPKNIKKLYASNVNKLLISMYDGPEQRKKFLDMTKKPMFQRDFVILRDRWHDETKGGFKNLQTFSTIDIGIRKRSK